MKNKNVAENPLLYIQQPTITTPVAPMQHHYYTPKHHQEPSNQKGNKHIRTMSLRRTQTTKTQDVDEELSKAEFNEKISDQNKFKDMTIIQKVNYFINRPDYAPLMKCEIKTSQRKHQGIITGFENDHVFIRIGRRSSSSEIPLSDITDIRMIGF